MGSEIVYCNTCGTRLLESDFKKGRAKTILTRNYCLGCMPEEAPKPKEETKQRKMRTTRVPRATKPPSPWPIRIGIGVAILVFIIIFLVIALK